MFLLPSRDPRRRPCKKEIASIELCTSYSMSSCTSPNRSRYPFAFWKRLIPTFSYKQCPLKISPSPTVGFKATLALLDSRFRWHHGIWARFHPRWDVHGDISSLPWSHWHHSVQQDLPCSADIHESFITDHRSIITTMYNVTSANLTLAKGTKDA